jgi:hypothetical protein
MNFSGYGGGVPSLGKKYPEVPATGELPPVIFSFFA